MNRTQKYGERVPQQKIVHGAKSPKAGQAWLELIGAVRKAEDVCDESRS